MVEKKNPISLQFPLKLSLLLHPFLYPWQVIISPINPASFIPGLWSSLLREKLIVISSQYLPESFQPERVVEKWKVKIVAQCVTKAPGSLGASTSWANRASLIRTRLKCMWERQKRQDWPRLSIWIKIEPIPRYSMVSWKTRANHHLGSFFQDGTFCRRLQNEALSVLWFLLWKSAMCWLGVTFSW